MTTSPKDKALAEMSRLAARHGIVYLVIDEELIQTYADDLDVKLDDNKMSQIKDLVFDRLQDDVEGHIESAVEEVSEI